MNTFLILLEPREGESPPGRPEVLAHCERLQALGREGRLIAAGPFADEKGGGMIVATFPDEAEAWTWAKSDPFVTCGYERARVRAFAWSRPENGQLGLVEPEPGGRPGWLEALRLRATTREFSPEAVSRELAEELLLTGLHAPSEFHLQPWRPVACHSQEDRERLRRCCWDQAQVTSCGLAVLCVADPRVLHDEAPRAVEQFLERGRYPEGSREEKIAFIRDYYRDAPEAAALRNAVLFGHHLLLAAFGRGLAGFWLGGVDHDRAREEFGIPPQAVIAGVVGVGWPAGPGKPMPRDDAMDRVGWGAWRGG